MSTDIYYFSGTGNSLFVAKELQKRLPESRLRSVVSCMNQKRMRIQASAVGIVFPVHAITIPIIMKKFIEQTDFSSADYIFAVATRMGTLFRGFEKIERLLKRQGKKLNARFILNMANNEARHESFSVPTDSEIKELENNVLDKLDLIQDIVNAKQTSLNEDQEVLIEFGHHLVINTILEKAVLAGMSVCEHTGGVQYFYADEKCIGCGICEKVCLSGKIKMHAKKPVWQRKVMCTMCFACLNYCPGKAVQIKDIPGVKSYTRMNGRYTHPYASVKDIEAQK